ncbi:MAG: cytochrome c [Caldilineaceae bacterium]
MTIFTRFRIFTLIGLLFGLALTASCSLSMESQPRYEPFEESNFFADKASVRPRVADTVARGHAHLDEQLDTGRINGDFAPTFPFTITTAIIERGQQRYTIFCTPCHGAVGDGHGIVTQYGMKPPPSFHSPDLRDEPPGYYFDIITNGTRVMPSYAARIAPADRWAIIAYIRALQLSQNADVKQLPASELPKLGQTNNITQSNTITKSDTVTK